MREELEANRMLAVSKEVGRILETEFDACVLEIGSAAVYGCIVGQCIGWFIQNGVTVQQIHSMVDAVIASGEFISPSGEVDSEGLMRHMREVARGTVGPRGH